MKSSGRVIYVIWQLRHHIYIYPIWRLKRLQCPASYEDRIWILKSKFHLFKQIALLTFLLQTISNQSMICAHLLSVSSSGSTDSSSDWFRIRGFLHASPPSHRQTTVHQSLEQMQVAVRHPGVLPLQWVNFSISACADSVPVAAVRGSWMPWWSSSQPWLVGSIVGSDSRSAAFYVATCRWHLFMFSTNASLPGGRGRV